MNVRAFAAAVFLLVIIGCEQQHQQDRELARVGNVSLTEAQARAAIDTTIDSYENQLRNYVSSWITTEILYQEAVKKGVEQSNEFQRQLNDLRREVAIQEFLQQEVFAERPAITDDSLLHYFEQHQSEFFAREDMVELKLVGFKTREQASAFAARVTRGASWDNVYASMSADTTIAREIIFGSYIGFYSEQTMLFSELWKVAQTLGKNDVSYPVRTPAGYFIMQMSSSIRSGTVPPFSVAKEEVRTRLLKEQQQSRYDSLIGTLRQQYAVQILLSPEQQKDTNQ